MTKKELEKEATEYALEWGDKTDGTYACCRDGYLAGAEPREKRIEELEKSNENLANQSMIFCQRNAELEMLVQKLKCCENCKHHGFAGNELICHLESYETELECLKTKSHWEISD